MEQDELADAFSRAMTFTHPAPIPTPPPEQAVSTPELNSLVAQPTTYASVHYTAPVAAKPTGSSPLPEAELLEVFNRNCIDPTVLYPTQVTLFQNADDNQRLRLLELWRISPPTYSGQQELAGAGTWPETSLQQEEAMARIRYERRMQEGEHQIISFNQTELPYPQNTAGLQGMELEQRPSTAPASSSPVDNRSAAEPYILSGYEQLARRDYEQQSSLRLQDMDYKPSTDPAYRGSDLWSKEDMENQYGAFSQMREYDWGHQARGGFQAVDEEMVM